VMAKIPTTRPKANPRRPAAANAEANKARTGMEKAMKAMPYLNTMPGGSGGYIRNASSQEQRTAKMDTREGAITRRKLVERNQKLNKGK
jgi:hypothetical protein